MSVTVEQRRICWPDFDCTCLEGGCGYCNDNRFRSVSSIDRAIEQGKGVATNRGTGAKGDLRKSFDYGQRHRWNNAESRIVRMKG